MAECPGRSAWSPKVRKWASSPRALNADSWIRPHRKCTGEGLASAQRDGVQCRSVKTVRLFPRVPILSSFRGKRCHLLAARRGFGAGKGAGKAHAGPPYVTLNMTATFHRALPGDRKGWHPGDSKVKATCAAGHCGQIGQSTGSGSGSKEWPQDRPSPNLEGPARCLHAGVRGWGGLPIQAGGPSAKCP